MTLETRIEKAIAENTDPFTTDADIRFFETEELKTFMNDLWGAEGDFIDTPLGRGRIENVRTKAGIDLAVWSKFLKWMVSPCLTEWNYLKWSVSNDPNPQRTYWSR